MTLGRRIKSLEAKYGGLREAGRVLGIDAGYLKRLRSGEKQNPSDEVLDRLGLEKRVSYVLK